VIPCDANQPARSGSLYKMDVLWTRIISFEPGECSTFESAELALDEGSAIKQLGNSPNAITLSTIFVLLE
jgi:hypothetical protein